MYHAITKQVKAGEASRKRRLVKARHTGRYNNPKLVCT